MKAKYKSLLALALTAPLLTGCLEEAIPTDGVIQSQLNASEKAADAIIMSMPAYMSTPDMLGASVAYDWGYPSIMHIRDVMTADMPIASSSYNWFSSWSAANEYIGDEYMTSQFVWTFYCKQVLACNKAIAAIDPETATESQIASLGSAYAFRAAMYLDMSRMYEPLYASVGEYNAFINSDNNVVWGLTVPIVTENTTEEEARNNPRASHDTMFDFIKSDLEKAEEYLTGRSSLNKGLPDLGVTYGLFARLYLWDAGYQEEAELHPRPVPAQPGEGEGEGEGGEEAASRAASTPAQQYAQAAEYARKAITVSGATPMTENEWLNTSTGFNTLEVSSWMWGIQQMKEDGSVQTGLLNWTSWLSNEAQFGYASAGSFVQINAALYNSISDRDFRKLAFVAPESSSLSGKESYCDAEFAADFFEPYYSLKFRPNSGDTQNYQVGAASAYPLMRVEEMYFIEAEAKAHVSPGEGMDLLNTFMKTYRYSTYKSYASSMEDVVNEIILQKRIEFFGEGLTFFDVKRLDMSVTRAYEGTNFAVNEMYNTNGRPAWMNFVFVQSEGLNNAGVDKFNNPNSAALYTPVRL